MPSARAFGIRRACSDDARSMALIHLETWKSAYAGIVDEHTLREMSLEESEQRQRRFLGDERYLSFVATVNGQDDVIGFATGGPIRKAVAGYDGELFALHVHPRYQGRGIGTGLMDRLARSMHERGFARMMAWAFSENPAKVFYEKRKGVFLTESVIAVRDQNLRVTSYGWKIPDFLEGPHAKGRS